MCKRLYEQLEQYAEIYSIKLEDRVFYDSTTKQVAETFGGQTTQYNWTNLLKPQYTSLITKGFVMVSIVGKAASV